MLLEFSTGGNGFVAIAQAGTTLSVAAFSTNSPPYDYVLHRGYVELNGVAGTLASINSGSYANGTVVSAGRSSASAIYLKNGLTVSRTTEPISGALVNNNGATMQSYRTGVHHAFCVISGFYNASLENRIAHSYAFSFKSFG
jgi:hypothetical protein